MFLLLFWIEKLGRTNCERLWSIELRFFDTCLFCVCVVCLRCHICKIYRLLDNKKPLLLLTKTATRPTDDVIYA